MPEKTLNEKQKKQLRKLAHLLNPVVIIGDSGLTENVLREIDLSLEHHELLKIKINSADREQRGQITQQIAKQTCSVLVQSIGHVAVFYRRSEKAKIDI